jgi:hypothetical protein
VSNVKKNKSWPPIIAKQRERPKIKITMDNGVNITKTLLSVNLSVPKVSNLLETIA